MGQDGYAELRLFASKPFAAKAKAERTAG